MESFKSDLINDLIKYDIVNKNLDFKLTHCLSFNFIIHKFIKILHNLIQSLNINYLIGISPFSKHLCSILSYIYNYKLLFIKNKRIINGLYDYEKNNNVCLIDDIYSDEKYVNILKNNKINIINSIYLFNRKYIVNNSNNHYIFNIFDLIHYNLIDNIDCKVNKNIENSNNSSLYNKLISIKNTKKTNLCLDCSHINNYTIIVNNIEKYGKNLCVLIINSNIINNFTLKYGLALKKLALNYNFLLINDLKISNNNQININIYQWCNFITLFHYENYSELDKKCYYLICNSIENNKLLNIHDYNIIGHITENNIHYNLFNFINNNSNINNADIVIIKYQ